MKESVADGTPPLRKFKHGRVCCKAYPRAKIVGGTKSRAFSDAKVTLSALSCHRGNGHDTRTVRPMIRNAHIRLRVVAAYADIGCDSQTLRTVFEFCLAFVRDDSRNTLTFTVKATP